MHTHTYMYIYIYIRIYVYIYTYVQTYLGLNSYQYDVEACVRAISPKDSYLIYLHKPQSYDMEISSRPTHTPNSHVEPFGDYHLGA